MSHQLRQKFLRPFRSCPRSRFQSTKPPSPPNTKTPPTQTGPTNADKSRTRINTLLTRLPKFLHPYTSGLRTAPITHVISFLILHEITAVVPLIGFASWFHWGGGMGYLPGWMVPDKYVPEYMEMFGRWFRRRGWFGFSKDGEGKGDGVVVGEGGNGDGEVVVVEKEGKGKIERVWMVGERGSRILVEVATAYAITKVLLPVRVLVSLWGTPWFARRVLGVFGRWRGGRGK